MCLTTIGCSMAQEDFNKVLTLKQLNDNRIAYLFYIRFVCCGFEMVWNCGTASEAVCGFHRPDDVCFYLCGLFASLTSAFHIFENSMSTTRRRSIRLQHCACKTVYCAWQEINPKLIGSLDYYYYYCYNVRLSWDVCTTDRRLRAPCHHYYGQRK